jgi:uncharacterized protein (TIGR00299 family) protein
MIVAALVDLGVPASAIEHALSELGLTGFHVHFGQRERHAIVGTSFDVHIDADPPHRDWRTIRALLEGSRLEPTTKGYALATFRRLAAAEAKVHRTSIDEVHFHEVGAVDAIVDVVASSAALAYLGATVMVSPLPVGRGFVRAAHGRIPLPAPAVLECLQGFPVVDGGLPFEFVTPTGAAIVGAHASPAERWPAMHVECTGFGAGTASLEDRPNLLRAVLGRPFVATMGHEALVQLEANLDDVTGEVLAYCMEQALAAGARDAWIVPIIMKKGRAAQTISVLVRPEEATAMTELLLRETPTLGVRRSDVSRVARSRHLVTVETPWGPVPIKVSEAVGDAPAQAKPEYDVCANLARTQGIPLREVLRAALEAFSARAR